MIEVHGLQKSYPMGGAYLPVLDIKALHVPSGIRWAFVGPSGTGKTTLLHLFAGILTPTAGNVQVAGTDLTSLRPAERDHFRACNIGYVFQSFNLLAAFSALENVMLSMRFSKGIPQHEHRTRATELLQRVGLAHRLVHKPAQLSNGEQQRVAVARALANKPRLLLMDEPSAHLDTETAQHVTELVGELCAEEGVTLLVATHDPHLIESVDHVLEMRAINRVLSQGAVV